MRFVLLVAALIALLYGDDTAGVVFALLAIAYSDSRWNLTARLRTAIDQHNARRAAARSSTAEYRMSEPPIDY